MKGKIIIVHPEKQHSLKMLSALRELGYSVKLLTSFGISDDSIVWKKRNIFPNFIKSRLINHKSSDSNAVIGITSISYLLFALIRYFDTSRKITKILYPLYIKHFNRVVLEYFGRTNDTDVAIFFDSVSGDLIKKIKCRHHHIKLVTDMSAPYYPFMLEFFEREYNSRQLGYYPIDKFRLANAHKEVKYSDYFFSASSVTKKSLLNFGVKESKIKLSRYDLGTYSDNIKIENNAGPLKILYVGNVCFEKGIHTLIDAVTLMKKIDVEVTMVGEYKKNKFCISGAPNNFKFTGHLKREQLINHYMEHDIFVFPSLADGFGFVVSEAIQHNLPVICSSNAGAKDLIINGVNGLVFNVADVNDLKDKILKIISSLNKDKECKKVDSIRTSYKEYLDFNINSIMNS
ncbi:glycosyltransferase family 4 protein [Vibrio splendidus]